VRVIRCLALLAAFALAMPPAVSDAVAGASVAALQAAYAGMRQMPALFGTREIYSADIAAFDKWTGMLARFRLEQAAAQRACAAEAACAEWRQILGALDGLDLRAKLAEIEREIPLLEQRLESERVTQNRALGEKVAFEKRAAEFKKETERLASDLTDVQDLVDEERVRVEKLRRGEPIRRCIACNTCINEMRGGARIGCVVNAAAGRENMFADRCPPRDEGIAVIGAGTELGGRVMQNMLAAGFRGAVRRHLGFTDCKDVLSRSYDPWEYCVQDRETAFYFVSRLMEHEGIYYYFEHTASKHTLVLADSKSSHQPVPGLAIAVIRDGKIVHLAGYGSADLETATPLLSLIHN